MLLSLLLARQGISVLTLERHADFEREYRGEVLMPRFTRMMQRLDLMPVIEHAIHRKLEGLQFHFLDERIASISFEQVCPDIPYALWMPQPSLLGALRAEAAKHASFALWFDATARELIRESGRVVGLRVDRSGEPREIRAKVVVGADGRFSTLRRLGGFRIEYEQHDFDVLWFTLKEPPGTPAAFRAYLTPERAYLALPKHPALLQCGMMLPPDSYSTYRSAGIESLKAHLRAGPSFVREFAETVSNFEPFTLLRATLDLVAEWAQDGIVLIGDAAHTCSPAGAVGVSIAAETAEIAAIVLADAIRRNDTSKPCLARIQFERESIVRGVQDRQRRLARFVAARSPLARRAFAFGISILGRTGILARVFRPLASGVEPPRRAARPVNRIV